MPIPVGAITITDPRGGIATSSVVEATKHRPIGEAFVDDQLGDVLRARPPLGEVSLAFDVVALPVA
ncbi:hypothetical protein G5V59_27580 [Nocardioides sp. W3-2-3]|nr:hypothetical protein [Nocardioides convexus]NHA02143.1 hypothetical protein [Nocardioides convexus]